METIAVTPEQGRQIVNHLNLVVYQLCECLEEYSKPREFYALLPGLSPSKKVSQKEKFKMELQELAELGSQVKNQVEQGQVEKQLLIELNEKLGKIQADYGNILALSATVAAIISGLKDLIDLFLGK